MSDGIVSAEQARSDDVLAGDRVWFDDGWSTIMSIAWTDSDGGYYSFSAEDDDGRSWGASWVSGRPILRLRAVDIDAAWNVLGITATPPLTKMFRKAFDAGVAAARGEESS
jgi:hypothetical protein